MRHKFAYASVRTFSTLLLLLFAAGAALGQTTSFTYQGRLSDGSTPANGAYDMKFRLYDADNEPVGSPDNVTFDSPGVTVTNGVFTVQLDFGPNAFEGGARYLEISVRAHSADPASPAYTTLSPRQQITSTPYAIRSLTAATAGTAMSANTATTAASFSGSLSGDVTGTQTATTVATVGGLSAASVANGATAANNAASANTAGAVVKRDASGNFSAGTITATLDGNASTATTATTATNATTATTANAVSSSAGDSVITAINAGSSTINAARLPSTLATQNGSNTFSGTNTFSTAPTFSAGLAAGGQRVTNVGTPTASTDAATKAYVDANVTSSTAGGDLSGTYPNPSIATTAGANIVAAVNASAFSINASHVSGDVELVPSATQTATQASGATRALIDVKLVGTDRLGTTGDSDLLSLKASGTYNFYTGAAPEARDRERFRVDNSGGFVAFGDQDIGGIPAEGAGTRFMWMPYKAATRGGYVNGTQWDDANVGYYSTAFGYNARASGDYGFAAGRESVAANIDSIALGNYVTASGAACVGLGYYAHCNTRQGSFVFSDRSVVDDGNFVTDESFKATVNHSFNVRATGGLWFFTNTAVNTGLRLSHLLSSNTAYGSFVWTDRSSDTAVTPTAQNQTIFRSSGGYWLYSSNDLSAGVTLAPGGGSWNNISDRNVKANFAAVNPREILRGVLSLPISTWNYKAQAASVRHIGPMAQDFFAAFNVGDSDKTITTVDPDGVALAAIQGLHEELKDRDSRIDGLQQQVRQQQDQIEGLKRLLCLDHPEASVCKEGR